MEKPLRSKPRISIFQYATFGFPTQPYSPTGRDRPVISIVPEAARRKKKNDSFDTKEPTSPKVSCIGQVKHKKHCEAGRKAAMPPLASTGTVAKSSLGMFLKQKGRPHRNSDAGENVRKQVEAAASAPPIGQMRRFASGRDGLAGFDWRQKANVDGGEEEDDMIVPHSAPMVMGGESAVSSRKEVLRRGPRRRRYFCT